MSTKSSLKEDDISPESLEAPYEDINTKQKRLAKKDSQIVYLSYVRNVIAHQSVLI
jgi:hypothetical protein